MAAYREVLRGTLDSPALSQISDHEVLEWLSWKLQSGEVSIPPRPALEPLPIFGEPEEDVPTDEQPETPETPVPPALVIVN